MAQKVLKTSLNYTIDSAGNIELISNPGGTITINTGSNVGTTVVTGDLTVLGTTTVVESTVVSITDNIITLNSGETGSGVTAITSGISIDRGTSPSSSLVWNESTGSWEFYKNLTEFGPGTMESLTLSLGETVNNIDDDTTLAGDSSSSIPTQHAVKTYVDTSISASANTIFQDDTSVTVYDLGLSGSYVETIIDNVQVSQIDSTGLHIDSIGSYTSSGDLTILADSTGELVVERVVTMPYQVSNPLPLAGSNKFFSYTPGAGGSGLYFTNDTTADELVSKTKAIVYSIIF